MMAERPMSPFWVYRWMYTNTFSILHRVTGVALVVALLGLVLWLISIGAGPQTYAAFEPLYSGVPAKLVIALALIGLTYHFFNGIRHLIWDIGYGFERASARRSATALVVATVIVSAACIYCLFAHGAPTR
jgi:succinate dehydrogenase / fumarate reductase cytochrome b subunit